ncbi:hypothetical protein BAOM_3131 [Peribacillus asahii]|uniref:Uncharacterized protein n=2 Tax=Peribacillus asahii TaxID=228899 RepID=A0A3T0KTW5_9BACI|nr:hypothetical protein BAOM_3131 [Peribacillus asahii]
MYRKIYQSSTNAAGSALKEYKTFEDSLQARINRATVAIEKLALALGDAFLTDGMVEGLETFISLLGSFEGLIKTIGGLPVILGVLSTAVLMLNKSFWAGTAGVKGFQLSLVGLGTVAKTTGTMLRGLAAASGVGLAFVAIGAGLEFLLSKQSEARQRAEELEQQNRALTESYKEHQEDVESLTKEYEKYEELISTGEFGVDYDATDIEKYRSIANDLAKIMPELVIGEDQYGNKLIGSSERIKAKTADLEKQLAIQEKLDAIQRKEEVETNYDNSKKDLKDRQKELDNFWAGTSSTLNLDSLEEAEKMFDRLQDKLANGKKLNLVEQGNFDYLKDVIKEYKGLETEVESLAFMYKQNLMEMIDVNVKLDDATSTMAKSVIDDFTSFVSSAGLSDQTLSKVFDDLLNDVQYDSNFKKTLEDYSSAIKDYQDAINKGSDTKKIEEYKNKATDAFDAVKDSLLNLKGMDGIDDKTLDMLTNQLISSGNAALVAGIDFTKLAEKTGMTTKEIQEQLGLLPELEDGISGTGNSSESTAKSISELQSAVKEFGEGSEEAANAQEQLTDMFDDAISNIDSLNGVLDDLKENQKLSADSIGLLIEKYPHLLGYIGNEKELRKQIQIEMENEEKVAKQVMLAKLEYNDVFYKAAVEANSNRVKAFQDLYGVDLTMYKNLGEAKVAVENEVLAGVVQAWSSQLESIETKARNVANIVNAMTGKNGLAGLMNPSALATYAFSATYSGARDYATKVEADFNDIFLDRIEIGSDLKKSTDSNTKSTRDNSKAVKDAAEEYDKFTYVVDKSKDALEKANKALEKQQAKLDQYPKYSKEYRNALLEEINLLEKKNKAIDGAIDSIDKQIKTGKYITEGVVSQSDAVKDTFYSPTSTSSKSSSAKLAGSSNAEKAMNFFISQGYSPQAAAGIVGNLQQESTPALNPKQKQYDGGPGRGIAQWTSGKAKGKPDDRWEFFLAWAASKGLDPYDLETQLMYIVVELEGKDNAERTTNRKLNARGGVTALKNNRSVESSTRVFQESFERAGKVEYAKRYKYANDAYNKYGKSAKASTASVKTASVAKPEHAINRTSSADVAQWYLDTFRMSGDFGQKDALHPNGHWGSDMNVKGTSGNQDKGTPIKSLTNGTVKQVFSHKEAGNAIVIQGEDGKEYRYIHLESLPKFKAGDSIKAGQTIGKMGSTGTSTAAHLDLKIKDSKGNYINPETYIKDLAKGGDGSKISAVSASTSSTLKVGSRGSDVKELQKALGIPADGIFGKDTEKAVKAFQKKNKLAVDGIAGAQTLKALGIKVDAGKTTSEKESEKSKKAAENQQNEDAAKQEKADLQNEILQNNAEIQQIYKAVADSFSEQMERNSNSFQSQADAKQEKAEYYGVATKKGRAYLSEQYDLLEKQEKQEQKDMKALQDWYKKEKPGMDKATRAYWNDILGDMRVDNASTKKAMQEVAANEVQAWSDQYDAELAELQTRADRKRQKAEMYGTETAKGRAYLKEEAMLLEQIEKKQQYKIKNIEKEVKAKYKAGEIDKATFDSYMAYIQGEWKDSATETQVEIQAIAEEVSESIVNEMLDAINKIEEANSRAMDKIEGRIHRLEAMDVKVQYAEEKGELDELNRHLSIWERGLESLQKDLRDLESIDLSSLASVDDENEVLRDIEITKGAIESTLREIKKVNSEIAKQEDILKNVYGLVINEHNAKLNQLLKERQDILNNIAKLEAKHTSLTPAKQKENLELIQAERDKLDAKDLSIFDQQQTIKELYSSIADEYVDAMKEAYEAERTIKLKQLDKIREAEQKAHDERIERLNEEGEKLDELYNKRIREIDDKENADNYDKELSKKQQEAQEIQNKINKLSMDDSTWAKKQRDDLSKQLADKNEEIQDFIHDRSLELRKQSLQDEYDAKKENINQQVELENEAWDKRSEEFDSQQEFIEKMYDNMINNERYWSKVRQDILKGDIAQYTSSIGTITETISSNAQLVGLSVSENITDVLNESLLALESLKEGFYDLQSASNLTISNQDTTTANKANIQAKKDAVTNAQKYAQTSVIGASSADRKKALTDLEKAQNEYNKLEGVKDILSTAKATIDLNMYDDTEKSYLVRSVSKNDVVEFLGYEKGYAKVKYDGAVGYVTSGYLQIGNYSTMEEKEAKKKAELAKLQKEKERIGKELTKAQASGNKPEVSKLTKELDVISKEYDKVSNTPLNEFHDGGIVGKTPSTSNKLTELANKLFNTKPNEEVIKSLKGELQIPPKNIPNIFTNMKNLIKSVTPNIALSPATTTVNMNINIAKLEGGEKGANELFKVLNKNLAGMGLK